jgi:hypothetical protein
VWLVAEEPEKTFLQGLIQVAAAFHHFTIFSVATAPERFRCCDRRCAGWMDMRWLLQASLSCVFQLLPFMVGVREL